MTRNEKPSQTKDRRRVNPRVDVYENEKEILLLADLPGVTRDDLVIQADGDTLALEARRSDATLGTELATEYERIDFSRTFTISPVIDKDRIEAKLEAGVLHLHLPKQAAQAPRKIPVRVG